MAHYFSQKQESALKTRTIPVRARGFSFNFTLSSATFSAKRIDFGSQLLADKMLIQENDKVLDLGCGTGFLGLVASKLTKNKVVLTDINERACKIASLNTKSCKDCEVRTGSLYEPVKNEEFNVILCNPPQTAGKNICFQIIEQAFQHLKEGGSLQIVARHNVGGKTLSRKMEEIFGNIDAVAKRGGFRIYISYKRKL